MGIVSGGFVKRYEMKCVGEPMKAACHVVALPHLSFQEKNRFERVGNVV
jgi:hypothetical protein